MAQKEWDGLAFTWPVEDGGIESSSSVSAGLFDSSDEALKAAELKMWAIGGVGFAARPIPH